MEEQNYGSVWDRIRLINEWYPIAAYSQEFLKTTDPHKRAVIVVDCCEWLADKTGTQIDDELASHISAVLRSKEGEAFLRWAIERVTRKDDQ